MRYVTVRKSDGTLNPPVLVVKAIPFVGAAARAVTGALGKKKLGKVGINSATVGTTGKTSLDQAMDMATDSGPPAGGFGTKTLENTATSTKQSMTNLDGGGTVAVKPPTDMGSLSTTDTTPVSPPKEKTNPLMRDRSAPPNQSTLKPDDPTLSTAVEESAERQTQAAADKKLEDATTYNVPKPLQRFFGEKIDRDKAQHIGGAGLIGVQQMRGQAAQKDAARQQEAERIERIAEDGRAKANTGAKVAVA
jgi:hypothetical protein